LIALLACEESEDQKAAAFVIADLALLYRQSLTGEGGRRQTKRRRR
jgi:hypothetical protein